MRGIRKESLSRYYNNITIGINRLAIFKTDNEKVKIKKILITEILNVESVKIIVNL